jgi:DNA integrity scanning protein DisA with diadenylate cyclase activity
VTPSLSLSWPHISVISIVDIVLVAILIYQFLGLVRGTRAAPMLVGVAVLALAFYFARLGELRTWAGEPGKPHLADAVVDLRGGCLR